MAFISMFDLQLFAGEGTGGDGSGASATAGAGSDEGAAAPIPAEQRLAALGVPPDVLNRRANRKHGKARTNPAPVEQASTAVEMAPAPEAAQQDAAAETYDARTEATAVEPASPAPARMTWEEILADPEYNEKMQQTMKARLREDKGAAEKLAKLAPTLEVLARRFDMDVENMDFEALADAVSGEDSHVEEIALRMGLSMEEAKKFDRQERDAARQQVEQERTLRQQFIQNHIAGLQAQSEELRKIYPDFDLLKELEDPQFAKMTSPGGGCTVKFAYEAKYHGQLMAKQAEQIRWQTIMQQSQNIQAGYGRPIEHGASGQMAPVNNRSNTPSDHAALKRLIEEQARLGNKVYPGQFVPR